ncbi:MAG: HisA/HisF-related TIM barrel protein [Hyphomicrobiales bacterium]
MEVIPVIDLRQGLVVRAIMGRRDLYKPIETPLSKSAAPLDVVAGLLGVHPFGKLYIADLDAIEATGDNLVAVVALRERFPHLDIWVDNGAASVDSVRSWLDCERGTIVIGSESQMDCALMDEFRHEIPIVLSLDFRGDKFEGPAELLDPSHWPQRVVAMTLARVGAGAGPDFERLAWLRSRSREQRLYAAGGVRGGEDLVRLREMGITGALVASSLHDGRLSGRQIAEVASD